MTNLDKTLYQSFIDWARKTFTPSYQEEIDAYFKHCQDVADVDRTILNLQRRGML